MATNLNDLTPPVEDGSDPNPQGGTDQPVGSSNGAPNEAPPNWEEKFKNSSREAQRLLAEQRQFVADRARYEAELALLRQQATSAVQATREEPRPNTFWTDEETKEFNNAVIDQNTAKVNHLNSIAMQRAAKKAQESFYADLQSAQTVATRNQALAARLSRIPGALDPNSPVNARMQEKYAELMRDPNYAHLPRQQVDFGGGVVADPVFLTLAADRVEAETRPPVGAPSVRQDSFTEPSNRSAAPSSSRDPRSLMFREELDMCDRTGMKPADFAKYEPTWAERVKQGKPLARGERRPGEAAFTFRPTRKNG